MQCIDLPTHGATAWWCSVEADGSDGRCPQCRVVAAWLAAGADPDTMPSFLRCGEDS